ncbi:hypothetical protein [Streptomyces sp. SudanB25_2051]|uniref:hypothetical protein n=1 Tax=Streptomyces sp. SudanB25_2051 TaxID=3035275 RepID=UPI003F56D905
MSEQTVAIPPMPETPPPSPRRKNYGPFLVGLGTGIATSGVVALILFLTIGGSRASDAPAVAVSPSASTTPAAAATAQEATEAPEEVFNSTPGAGDFTMTLKITSKQCFGSAGCNLTVEPQVSYAGLLPLDPGKEYSLTYEVHGSEDGSIIQTMELSDQTSLSYRPTVLTTSTSKTKLTVEVTDVEERG